MDNGKPLPTGVWVLYLIAIGPMILPVLAALVSDPITGSVVAATAGAAFIFWIVRWTNRRSDPPAFKRPPDPS